MANKSHQERILENQSLEDKKKLRNIAEKITKIPSKWQKIDGSLDLDKVHLSLMDYHKNAL